MAGEVNVRLEYSPGKDILSIIVLPERKVETRTMGYDHDFLVFHEKLNPQAITGIEALDFTETAGKMDYEGIVLPEFDFTSNVYGSSLRGIHFNDLLKWAYGEFVARAHFAEAA